MRSTIASTIAGVAAVVMAVGFSSSLPSAASAEFEFRVRCSAGKTILRSAEARYFGIKGQRWGCVKGQRRAWFIGDSGGSDACIATCTMDLPVLAGHWLGYAGHRVERDDSYRAAAAVDLRTGRKVRRDTVDADTPVADVAVSRTGRLAYIVRTSDVTHEVRINDADGVRVVDQGEGTAPKSLTIVGTEARWTSGGAVRTAQLV